MYEDAGNWLHSDPDEILLLPGTLVRICDPNAPCMGIVTRISGSFTYINRFKWDPTLDEPDENWYTEQDLARLIVPKLSSAGVRVVLGKDAFDLIISRAHSGDYKIFKQTHPEAYNILYRMLTP